MILLYMIFHITGNDKKRKALDMELENSTLTADEILQLGKEVKTDLFGIALSKRVKELGLERVPEWCVRDGVLPVKSDLS